MLAIITLTGCTGAAANQGALISLPQAFSQQPPEAQNTPAPLNPQWWQSANDAILNELLTTISHQNLSIEQAQQRLRAARESTDSSAYLPRITAQGSSNFTNRASGKIAGADSAGTFRAGLDMAWEVPLFGQFGASRQLTRANITYAKTDLAAIQASVASEAVQTYAELRAQQQQLEQLGLIVAKQQRIVSLTLLQQQAGLVGSSATQAATENLMNVLTEHSAARTNAEQALRNLAILSGQATPSPSWQLSGRIPVFQVPAPAQAPLDVLRSRPDLRRTEAQVLAAAAQLRLTQAERWPQLNFTGSLAQVGNVFGRTLPGIGVETTAAPVLSLPLLDWHQRLGKVRQQNAKLAESISAYRATLLTAFHETEIALLNYTGTQQQSAQAAQALAAAQIQNNNQQQLFQQGVVSEIDAATSAISAARAAIAAANAAANAAKAAATLAKALGGGLTSPTLTGSPA